MLGEIRRRSLCIGQETFPGVIHRMIEIRKSCGNTKECMEIKIKKLPPPSRDGIGGGNWCRVNKSQTTSKNKKSDMVGKIFTVANSVSTKRQTSHGGQLRGDKKIRKIALGHPSIT